MLYRVVQVVMMLLIIVVDKPLKRFKAVQADDDDLKRRKSIALRQIAKDTGDEDDWVVK